MKTKALVFFSYLVLLTLVISCDRPDCKNSNPAFDQYSPDTREYKEALLKELETTDKSKLTYWFMQYTSSNGQEELFFNIQGDGLCAVIVLNVENRNQIEELLQKKGVSFRGAEFKNLKFDIRQDSTNIRFIFRGYDKIID